MGDGLLEINDMGVIKECFFSEKEFGAYAVASGLVSTPKTLVRMKSND